MWGSKAVLNLGLLNLILLCTPHPTQVEKERELELQEKLEEQRRVLEGKHEAALKGKDGDAALERA